MGRRSAAAAVPDERRRRIAISGGAWRSPVGANRGPKCGSTSGPGWQWFCAWGGRHCQNCRRASIGGSHRPRGFPSAREGLGGGSGWRARIRETRRGFAFGSVLRFARSCITTVYALEVQGEGGGVPPSWSWCRAGCRRGGRGGAGLRAAVRFAAQSGERSRGRIRLGYADPGACEQRPAEQEGASNSGPAALAPRVRSRGMQFWSWLSLVLLLIARAPRLVLSSWANARAAAVRFPPTPPRHGPDGAGDDTRAVLLPTVVVVVAGPWRGKRVTERP